jgi:nicotinamidase/pyrazinamidase
MTNELKGPSPSVDSTALGRAIIVVDPQPDFFEEGPLPVKDATHTVARIAEFLRRHRDSYDVVVVTQDWHVEPGDHWSTSPNFTSTWPVHCVADSSGARIHDALADVAWDEIIRKGTHEGAYSGFEGRNANGALLANLLTDRGVRDVTVVGFATDHCVKATALDARTLGFNVSVVLDLCTGVSPDTTQTAIDVMADQGIALLNTEDLDVALS